MVQLVLTCIIYLILVIPVGRYLYHIAAGKHTFADPLWIGSTGSFTSWAAWTLKRA